MWSKSKSLNPDYKWQGLWFELQILWHLDGWFWFNSRTARWIAVTCYDFWNHKFWCELLDDHVCAYRPACMGMTTADKEFRANFLQDMRDIYGL